MHKSFFYCSLFSILFIFQMHAQNAPGNNECIDAINLSLETEYQGSTQYATSSTTNSSCGINASNVWYKFTAPVSGEIYLYMSGGGSLTYTLYRDCLGTNEIDCGSGNESNINNLQSGEIYYLSVTKTPYTCRGDCDYNFSISISQNTLSQEIFELKSISYYPNPVINDLTINASQIITRVNIYNVLGRELKSQTINTTKAIIDFSSLQSGIYFLDMYSNQNRKTIRIIKK